MWSREPVRPEHLYLHVPFCRERCPYCDYPVLVSADAQPGPWLDSVAAEADLRHSSGVPLDSVRTVLVGGGTPSVLGPGLGILADTVVSRSGEISEWTVEANPEDISDDVVRAWAQAGVTRVSLGVQSLRPETLRWLGRRHDPDVARRAMEVLARSPLETWSIDLIFGLPLAVDPDPVGGFDAVVGACDVPHVSVFELTLDKAGGQTTCPSGSADLPDPDAVADQYLRAHEALTGLGYEAYQVTSFARPGQASAHGEGILRSGSWVGLGPGAHSRLGGLRTWNLLDWRGYTSALAGGELPIGRAEEPDPAQEEEERLHGLLTRSAGIPPGALTAAQLALARRWARDGHATHDRSAVRLTPTGWLLLDGLARELARAGRAS